MCAWKKTTWTLMFESEADWLKIYFWLITNSATVNLKQRVF